MPDVTDATDAQNAPRGPSLDDVVDVVARTNRGILALSREVQRVQSLVVFALIFLAALILGVRTRLNSVLIGLGS